MRGCISKRKNGTYAYTIELGKHPVTQRRRQRLKADFATWKDAEQALVKALADLGRGSCIAFHYPNSKIQVLYEINEKSDWFDCDNLEEFIYEVESHADSLP
ncbi:MULTISPECIES: hypothetical protein [Paenibacillus]|uniref:hypothetical protein n=1 Tax=Paenibacillus TaxID=44249 RepID=UPI00096F2FDA|nr:hypothetical protein [Paenibacillus odorifer]OME07100.1 hypothetical protein BSK60_31785 [Paenibacillus odorifer]